MVATALVIILTSMAGYALTKSNLAIRKYIISIILLTIFLPRGYTIIPIFKLVMNLKLLNTIWAVILVNVATSMTFSTFLFFGYFCTLPKGLEESALIDGASFPLIFWKIVMPLAKPMIGTIALFEFIENWNSFFIPLVFTLSRSDLRTVSVGMYAFMGEHSMSWTLLCAAATMSLLPIMILFFILQKFFIEGLSNIIKR